MAENINIAGRLHSTATGNVVAGANEIYDDAKGKKQSIVNQETDAALDDRYTKEQTYSKSELNNLITTPNQQYVSVTATDQTTDVTDVLPTTGESNTLYRVGNWDKSQFDESVYSEYAWNGNQYVHLSTKTKIGEVFDISAYHATGDTLATYADLSAALDSNNGGGVPQSLQKGGMSVKYVRTSDNKYVQHRLIANEFTTDTTQWAIEEEGVYVENPEFVYVKTDKEGKILWAIKIDGAIYYGAGCPQQVKDYINEKLAELPLDELIAELNTKVDKEEGKSLIDADYASSQSAVENSEWLNVTTDSEGRILGGRKHDGTVVENMPQENPIEKKEYISNLEYIKAEIDSEQKIISGVRKDGVSFFGEIESNAISAKTINTQLLNIEEQGKKKLQDELGINLVNTNTKKQEFSLLFKETTGEVESFLFFSDPHYFGGYLPFEGDPYEECMMAPKAWDYIERFKDFFINTPTDFVLCGGDWLDEHKKSVAVEDLGWIDGFMNKEFNNKYYPMIGNHDTNESGEEDVTDDKTADDGIISNDVLANLWMRKYGKTYYSFKGNNTKFFIFDSGVTSYKGMDEYRWEQISWFASELLSNEDAHIVIGTHIVTNNSHVLGEDVASLADNFTKVADAFNNRTSITLNGETYDFSSAQGTVHCVLCGHVHYDATAIVNNIPVFAITCAVYGDFDLILIDYNQGKLKSVRIGTGKNREMNLI